MGVGQVCVEHAYHDIWVGDEALMTPLEPSLGLWFSLGHPIQDDTGHGSIFVVQDIPFLDAMSAAGDGLAMGAATRIDDDCWVRVRTMHWVVLAHEIGHCLCYDHNTTPGRRPHLMDAYYRPGRFSTSGLRYDQR